MAILSCYRNAILVGLALLLTLVSGVPVETYRQKTEPHSSKSSTKPPASTQEGTQPHSLKVIELTAENFGSMIGDGNVWLVEFYSPSCGHCRDFAPSYASIAATFHSSPQEGIRVAKIDTSAQKALRARFGIYSVPSFFIIDGWRVYEYDGHYSEVKLTDYARGGYKKQDSLPLLTSPMGPMGQLQGATIMVGFKVMDLFVKLQEAYGVSPLLAGVVLSFVGVIGGMVSIVLLTILTTPKTKDD